MHEVPLLINITLALVVAFLGGVIARRVKLPTIVGYLLAGIVIGPFTPGVVGDVATIQQLAELGVIFLMFGVGLHFSFQDLWQVRDIAIPGALIQTLFATLLGFGLTRLWGWPPASGIVLGLSISVASTVVLLRGLMDHSLLNTPHGQAAVGWLVMEDILSVLILVLMPALATSGDGMDWASLAFTLLKAAAFVVVMFLLGARLIPWLLARIASTRSRELFILAVLAITLGVAVGAAELFGVSLALGAFVAGAIVSQSHLSHQVGADVLPFRESFAVLFFVSVGMLVDPLFLVRNLGQVLALTALVMVGKGLIVLLLGLVLPRPARTFLVVAVGLSQIGEFSFILGQSGLALGLLEPNQYALILAGALISITLNPLMFNLLPVLEGWMQRFQKLWRRLDEHQEFPQPAGEQLQDHVVIVGYGRLGKQLADLLRSLQIPFVVVEADLERLEPLRDTQAGVLFGDAANSEVIVHAGLERARLLVSTVPDESTAATIVAGVKAINHELPVITRAATPAGVPLLSRLGADTVVQPELEGGLEMIYHTLLQLGFPLREVHAFAEDIRRQQYELDASRPDSLRQLLLAAETLQITWMHLGENSPLVGQSLEAANLRAQTGASVVAILRNKKMIANPKSVTTFEPGDRVGLIGDDGQIRAAEKMIAGSGA